MRFLGKDLEMIAAQPEGSQGAAVACNLRPTTRGRLALPLQRLEARVQWSALERDSDELAKFKLYDCVGKYYTGALSHHPPTGQRWLRRGVPGRGSAPGPPGGDQGDERGPPGRRGAPGCERTFRARGDDAGAARSSWPDADMGLFSRAQP